MKALVLLPLCLLLAVPAWAGDAPARLKTSDAPARPRLVAGGMNLAETSTPLYRDGAVSLGTLSSQGSHMSMGGYVAYALQDGRIATSLKGDGEAQAADVSASVTGTAGTAAIILNYEWAQPQSFSPNPQASGLAGYAPNRPSGDLSLSLSFSHDVNPAFTLGGFAAASRAEYQGHESERDFRLGAGLGLKF